MIIAAVPGWALLTTRPRTLSARGLVAWSRPLGAETWPARRTARPIRTISTRCWAISTWRTRASGPVATRPVARRTRSPIIETRSPRRSTWLLAPCWIDLVSIATPSLVRSASQHPPFASLGHLAAWQIGVAPQGIEATRATTSAASATGPTATTAARTSAGTTATTAGTARTTATTAAAISIAATATTTAIVAA